MLRRCAAIVDYGRDGDPFVAANADRLRAIACHGRRCRTAALRLMPPSQVQFEPDDPVVGRDRLGRLGQGWGFRSASWRGRGG